MTRPTVSQHRDRLGTHQPKWLDDTPLGIFIHWGAYSVPSWAEPHGELGTEPDEKTWFTHNSYAEWYFNTIRIPGSPASRHHQETYGSLPYDCFLDMWHAERFDPDDWAALFKKAGAGLVVPTAKHHDGITLWNAPETYGRNTVHRGPRRDLIEAISRATRQAGMRFGVYYSGGVDWHYRPFPVILSEEDLERLARTVDPEYGRYIFTHCLDLLTRYRPDVFWNDIDWPDCAKNFGSYGLGTLLERYYELCPEGVVNDRFGGFHSDYETSEYQAMRDSEGADRWENCRGIGLSFGYNRLEGDEQYLTGPAVAHQLVDVVSRGGRLLLNVGPRADGTIPAPQRACLEGLGAWMRTARPELSHPSPELMGRSSSLPGARLMSHGDHAVLFALDDVEVPLDRLPQEFDWSSSRAGDEETQLSCYRDLLTVSPTRLGPGIVRAERRF